MFLVQNVFHVLFISLPPRITAQTKPGLVTEHHIGPLSNTPMLMFQTPVQTNAFMCRREGNSNCWSSGIQASMIESPVNSLSRNSYSCGDCERRTQCSGSTVPSDVAHLLPDIGQIVMSRRKQRSAFDQVSELDRGRIMAYRDCGLSFRKIGSRVG
ncbi:uncharacterized protein TNCV_3597611 [Trichonephila clavipes]|nr:uncharacterized protein TNCV_3597611 [Trichonephila clavipes]